MTTRFQKIEKNILDHFWKFVNKFLGPFVQGAKCFGDQLSIGIK